MSSIISDPTFVHDASRDLVISRIIDASPARVFDAWTQRFTEWWGPHGMTTPFCQMDLRPGGIFRTIMRAPDGQDFPTKGVFLEIARPQRIVFTDAFEPGWRPAPEIFFTAVMTFEDVGGKTRFTAWARHWNSESRQRHEQLGFYHGWSESLDRLAAILRQPRA